MKHKLYSRIKVSGSPVAAWAVALDIPASTLRGYLNCSSKMPEMVEMNLIKLLDAYDTRKGGNNEQSK
jgi:hypothetical protein